MPSSLILIVVEVEIRSEACKVFNASTIGATTPTVSLGLGIGRGAELLGKEQQNFTVLGPGVLDCGMIGCEVRVLGVLDVAVVAVDFR